MTFSAKPKIGFIGLGFMGRAMVQRLQSLDYSVTVIAHRNRSPIEEAVARGAVEAKSPAELARASEIVMLCVDTSDAVEANMFGDVGVIGAMNEGGLVIDFGTSLPGSTKRIAAALAEKGIGMLDAPLGRTPAHAVDGLLNIMVGGSEEDFGRAKPLLDDLGENVFHVGPTGAGHTTKLINNFFAMTTATAMSEAFAMADLAGLPRQTVYQVMSAGPLHSGMMDFVKANAIDGNPNMLAFSITNARKDVGYYAAMADELGAPSFLSPATKQALGLAVAQGWGDHTVPQLVEYIEDVFSAKKGG